VVGATSSEGFLVRRASKVATSSSSVSFSRDESYLDDKSICIRSLHGAATAPIGLQLGAM